MKIHTSFGFFIFIAFLVILIPIKWVICWLLAQFFHEVFHIIALKYCKYRITSLRLGHSGLVIDGDFDDRTQMILCSLAGPCAGIILFCFFGSRSPLGICGLCQSAFNLLPVFPLDGGRSVRILLIRLAGSQLGARLFCIFELIFLSTCTVLFACLSFIYSRVYFVFLAICVCVLAKKLLAKSDGRLYNTDSFY